jgi:hypothetical protein
MPLWWGLPLNDELDAHVVDLSFVLAVIDDDSPR